MKNWTSKGHLSELALEMWAAREAEAHELQAMDSHVQGCPACRAQAAEWRGLFHALASLQAVEPSVSFDNRVMEQVRVAVEARAAAPAWLVRLIQKAPRIAAAVIGAWTVSLVLAVAWLRTRVDVPFEILAARFLSDLKQMFVAAVLKVAAVLHLSGFADWWAGLSDKVPGLGVAGAVALMTVLCGLAIWTLRRVMGYQPPRVDAHA
jgi:anti-sigma factor RsiW